MYTFRLKPALTIGRKLPFKRAGLRVERVKVSVVTADVNRAVCDGRRSGYRSVCRSLPNLTTGRGVDRIYIPIVSAEVDHVIFEDRRRNHAIAGWKFSFNAMELPRRRSRIRTGVHRITAKHRLRVDRGRCAKRGQQSDNP